VTVIAGRLPNALLPKAKALLARGKEKHNGRVYGDERGG